jgi:hypothetical protein
VVQLLVGARWDPGGTNVAVIDLKTHRRQVVRVGLQAEAQVIRTSPASIGIADYADPDLTAARLTIYEYPDLRQLGANNLPLERRAVANVPGPATFVVAPNGELAFVIGSSRDGYKQSVVGLSVRTGEPTGPSVELGSCGPAFVGLLERADTLAVVCPEPRTAYLLPIDAADQVVSVVIAPDHLQSWVAGVSFGSSDIVLCLSSQGGPWKSAVSVLRPDATVSAPVAISDELQAAPNSCSRWTEGRTAVGLWDGTAGEYDEVALLNQRGLNETLSLDEQVIGPLTLVGDQLVGASGDGNRVLWFNTNGTLVDSLGDVQAAGGLYP